VPPAPAAELANAIEVFARGFAFTRTFTHPYLAERVGPLWLMRDGPRRKADYRNEEWIAHSVAPQEVDRIAREHTRGRFAVCAICAMDEPEAPLREGFKALGYRLATTESFMVHDLEEIPDFESPAKIERVLTSEAADRLAKTAGRRQILPQHLKEDAPQRQYTAEVDGQLVGWVRSIQVRSAECGVRSADRGVWSAERGVRSAERGVRTDEASFEATWCSNMYVEPAYRRRGIARAMLCRMLRDDREHGARQAVLLASHTGAKLYPVVGYRQIGTLLLFTPPKTG
jgi:GNAT superfamily N-acetyltransferase